MANVKISALPAITPPLVGADLLPVVKSGDTQKATITELAGAMSSLLSGRQSVPIMAAGISPSATGGCEPLTVVPIAANQPDIITLDFDPTTAEYAQFSIPMPKKWNEGTITARFLWSHGSTATNFDVVWGIQAVAVSNNDAIGVAFGTAQTIADTGGVTNNLYKSDETAAITIGGSPVAEDTVFFRVYRLATSGSDTLAIDARLHGVILFLTTESTTDA